MSGWRVWALGITAIGFVSLALGRFDPGQPPPKWLPERVLIGCAADLFLVIAGTAAQWRRATMWATGALTIYYAVVVVVLMDGPIVLRHAGVFGSYSNTAEQLALAAAGLVAYASHARLDGRAAARLTRAGQAAFGVCAVLFGAAHFVYLDLTAPLVPKWLPPSQLFWAYATGVAQIAAGLAIVTGLRARPAAYLLAAMYASFTALVHLPLLFSNPRSAFFWTENALNLALIGAAWTIADSLRDLGAEKRSRA